MELYLQYIHKRKFLFCFNWDEIMKLKHSFFFLATKGNPLINLVNTPTDGTQDKLLEVEYLKVGLSLKLFMLTLFILLLVEKLKQQFLLLY